jgi:adenylosuccinate lyase
MRDLLRVAVAQARESLANYNWGMNFSPISALSPLDGRYASKLNALRPLMSEQGYMHRRVQVEIAWFIALSDAGFAEFKPLTPGARSYF